MHDNSNTSGDLRAIQDYRESLAMQYNLQHRTIVLGCFDRAFFVYDSYLRQLLLVNQSESLLVRDRYEYKGIADCQRSKLAFWEKQNKSLFVFDARTRRSREFVFEQPCRFALMMDDGIFGICESGKSFFMGKKGCVKFEFKKQVTKINRNLFYAIVHYADFSVDVFDLGGWRRLVQLKPRLSLSGIFEAIPGGSDVCIWAVPCSRDSVIQIPEQGKKQRRAEIPNRISKIMQDDDCAFIVYDNGDCESINKRMVLVNYAGQKIQSRIHSHEFLLADVYQDARGIYWRGPKKLHQTPQINMSLLFASLPELVLDGEIRQNIERTFENEQRLKRRNPVRFPGLLQIFCVNVQEQMQRVFRAMRNYDGSKRAELAEIHKLEEEICAADMFAKPQIVLNGISKIFCGGVRAYFLFADGRTKFAFSDCRKLRFEELQTRFADEIRCPKHIHVLTDTAQDKHDFLFVTQKNGEALFEDCDFFGEKIKTAFNKRKTQTQQYTLKCAALLYNCWGIHSILALAQDNKGQTKLIAFNHENKGGNANFSCPQVDSPIMLYSFRNYFAVIQTKKRVQFFMFDNDKILTQTTESSIKPPFTMTQSKHYWCDSAVLRTPDGLYMQPSRYTRTANQVRWNYNHLQYADFGEEDEEGEENEKDEEDEDEEDEEDEENEKDIPE